MRRRREIEVAGLSFLDCICCGFGAILLLLVITELYEPAVIEEALQELTGLIARLEDEIHEIRGETVVLEREMKSVEEQVSEEKVKLARLQGDLSRLRGEFAGSKDDAAIASTIQGRLARARQRLTEEMKRLNARPQPEDRTVGGIPVDSEYIIFVIDTSGSMQTYNWNNAIQKVSETLRVYPHVKGIQVMNDMGTYMFDHYADRWIPDSAARRAAILQRMRGWRSFSNSSPVEGITKAIRTFYASDKKISIYVFGDEFSGDSVQQVVDVVDRLNRRDASGRRRVRIHAVGFAIPSHEIQVTSERFAILMRALCQRNGGTFVGLQAP